MIVDGMHCAISRVSCSCNDAAKEAACEELISRLSSTYVRQAEANTRSQVEEGIPESSTVILVIASPSWRSSWIVPRT